MIPKPHRGSLSLTRLEREATSKQTKQTTEATSFTFQHRRYMPRRMAIVEIGIDHVLEVAEIGRRGKSLILQHRRTQVGV